MARGSRLRVGRVPGHDRPHAEAASSSSAGSRTRGLPIWISLPIIFAAVAATIGGHRAGRRASVPAHSRRLRPIDWTCWAVRDRHRRVRHPVVHRSPAGRLGVVIVAAVRRSCSDHRSGSNTPWRSASSSALSVWRRLAGSVVWSPLLPDQLDADRRGDASVVVNGIHHQAITTDRSIVGPRSPRISCPYERAVEPPERVLVIGAGTGADVSHRAVAEGAGRVDAVEIDPELMS